MWAAPVGDRFSDDLPGACHERRREHQSDTASQRAFRHFTASRSPMV